MKNLLLTAGRMDIQPVLDIFASASFDVEVVTSPEEAEVSRNRTSFALILLAVPASEMAETASRVRESDVESQSMIVGLLDENDQQNDQRTHRADQDCQDRE